MRVRRTVLAFSLVVILATSGLVVASNMGFKWAPTFDILARDYWISLPYKQAMASASALCASVPNATLVSRFDPATGLRGDWTCPGGLDFPLLGGEGVFIRVSAVSNPVFVGSHDPDAMVPPGGFVITGQDHIISLPYHTTAATASDLCGEIADATTISRFDTLGSIRSDWLCPGGEDFTIGLGEAFAVRVSATGPGFQPDHY